MWPPDVFLTFNTVLDRTPVAGNAGGVTGERPERPDPEVPERARRRTFTAQYKLEVLAAYDAAGPGEKGAILRREGMYSSHIVDWRRARDAGALAGLARPRGRPAADPRDAQIARLQKEKAQLEQELAKARFVVDVQAKLHAPCRRSPRARTPSPGPVSDRRGNRPASAEDRHPGSLRGGRRAAERGGLSRPGPAGARSGGRAVATRHGPCPGGHRPVRIRYLR